MMTKDVMLASYSKRITNIDRTFSFQTDLQKQNQNLRK